MFVLLLISPFWICRIVFLVLYPELKVDGLTNYLFYALRFDLKSLVIWYSPLFVMLFVGLLYKSQWLRKVNRFLFIVLYLAALVFGLVDAFYFEISKTVVGAEIFQLVKGQSFSVILGYVRDFWWAILLALLLVFIVILAERKTDTAMNRKDKITTSLILLVLIGFFARGGVALKPLNLMDAYAEMSNEEATTAVTPIYVLIESIGKKSIDYEEYLPDEDLQVQLAKDKVFLKNPFQNKPNICLILLESFGKEYTAINATGKPSYTPFLDSLMGVSKNYLNAYANGLRSMDAVASIYCGVPSFMKRPYIGSLYTNSTIESLPKTLKEQGYYTSFFHGADELSMGFKPFLVAQGLDEYVGKQQYTYDADFDGTWGIFDEPFLRFFAHKLSKQRQPWFSTVFTLSSHHPYTVPESYQYLPKGTSDIHQSVGYTDAALRNFFKNAANQPWFNNTVFILSADHTSINETPAYTNYRGKYAIPLMVYQPNQTPSEDSSVRQQIDLFSTIKSIAGIEHTFSFGRPLYDTTSRYSFQYDGNVYVCTSDSFSLVWNGVAEPRLFAYRKDIEHRKDILSEHKTIAEQMLHELKVFRQKYNYRLLNNDFK